MLPTIFMPVFDAVNAERVLSRPSAPPPTIARRISLERPAVRRPSLEHEALPELRKSA
ncbi:MAG TPA: hypothetical protein VFG84_10690 [Gemmatimonadaceae bacterium]|nr:hypothetical protein [Gemmatimonadaceae bacterium]